jgi:hypothetical protein
VGKVKRPINYWADEPPSAATTHIRSSQHFVYPLVDRHPSRFLVRQDDHGAAEFRVDAELSFDTRGPRPSARRSSRRSPLLPRSRSRIWSALRALGVSTLPVSTVSVIAGLRRRWFRRVAGANDQRGYRSQSEAAASEEAILALASRPRERRGGARLGEGRGRRARMGRHVVGGLRRAGRLPVRPARAIHGFMGSEASTRDRSAAVARCGRLGTSRWRARCKSALATLDS